MRAFDPTKTNYKAVANQSQFICVFFIHNIMQMYETSFHESLGVFGWIGDGCFLCTY